MIENATITVHLWSNIFFFLRPFVIQFTECAVSEKHLKRIVLSGERIWVGPHACALISSVWTEISWIVVCIAFSWDALRCVTIVANGPAAIVHLEFEQIKWYSWISSLWYPLVSMIHAFVSWFCYEADCRIVYVQLSGFGNCVLDSVDIKFFYTTRINVHSETWANVTCPMSMINHTHNLNEENKIDWKSNTRWENSADKTVMLDVANEKKNFQFDGYVNIKSPILTYLVTVRIKTDDYSRSLQHMSAFQLTIFDCRVSTSLHRQTVDVCYYDWEVAFGCHEHIWLHCKIIGY